MTTTAPPVRPPRHDQRPLCCARCTFISYIVRQNVEHGRSCDSAGVQAVEYAGGADLLGIRLPYLLFQIIGGVTADRFGPRRTLFVSDLVWPERRC